MKNLASGEGATLETIAIHAGVFVCVCVSLQLIPVQLALRRGFQNPPAGRWLRHTWHTEGWTGEEREREG